MNTDEPKLDRWLVAIQFLTVLAVLTLTMAIKVQTEMNPMSVNIYLGIEAFIANWVLKADSGKNQKRFFLFVLLVLIPINFFSVLHHG